MKNNTETDCGFQPIRASFKRILIHCIDNAAPSEAKAMILIAYENGLFGCAETFAMIATRGLEAA